MRCDFECHTWNKLLEVATRAIDSPCKALGGWRTHLGPGGAPVEQQVGKVRGGRVFHELDAVQCL